MFPRRKALYQRAFPVLPGSVQENDGSVGQRGQKRIGNVALNKIVYSVVDFTPHIGFISNGRDNGSAGVGGKSRHGEPMLFAPYPRRRSSGD
jgi:hypothetical protein